MAWRNPRWPRGKQPVWRTFPARNDQGIRGSTPRVALLPNHGPLPGAQPQGGKWPGMMCRQSMIEGVQPPTPSVAGVRWP